MRNNAFPPYTILPAYARRSKIHAAKTWSLAGRKNNEDVNIDGTIRLDERGNEMWPRISTLVRTYVSLLSAGNELLAIARGAHSIVLIWKPLIRPSAPGRHEFKPPRFRAAGHYCQQFLPFTSREPSNMR